MMAGEIRTFEIPRGQVASLAAGCKLFSIVFALLAIPLPIFTLSQPDVGLYWINGIGVALFALVVMMLRFEAHVIQKCVVWRADLQLDGVTIHTLSEQIFAPWNEIDSIAKQACSHGHTQFILTCKRGEPYRLPSTLDKTEHLFNQIRANVTTPSLRHSMLRVLQFQTIIALPIVLLGLAFLTHEIPYWGWSLAVLSASMFLFMCMFLCLDYDVSEERVMLRSPLACYNSDWRSIRTMKLSSYVRTAQGCFFFSGWLLDLEMLKQTIRIRCANQRNLLTDPGKGGKTEDAGYNRSGKVVALLALISVFAPLTISAYAAPVAALGALLTMSLGKPERVKSLLCLLLSIPGLLAPFMLPDFVSPNKPSIARLMDAFSPGIDLSQFVATGPTESLYGYYIDPPVSMINRTSISESGKLKKWSGRDIITGLYEITFMVAPEHASSSASSSARFEWSHPYGLSNITRVGSGTQNVDGLTFTINEWTATCGPLNYVGFDYIATKNGDMIAFRSFDGRGANARARAEAVMRTFHGGPDAGIPHKAPALSVPQPLSSRIDAKTAQHSHHAAKKVHHHKGKGR